MSILSKPKPKVSAPDPTSSVLYRPLVGFVSKHGSYAPSGRFLASDPGVQANPEYFVKVDISDGELNAIASARFPGEFIVR